MDSKANRFKEEMDETIREAEGNLRLLDFDPLIWRTEIKKYSNSLSVIDMTMVANKESISLFKLNSKNPEIKSAGIEAMAWARIAVFAHLAKSSDDPIKSFALGHSMKQARFDANQKLFSQTDHRRRSERGGSKKKGHVSAFTKLIKMIWEEHPEMTFLEFRKEVRKEPNSKILAGPMEEALIEKISLDDDKECFDFTCLTKNGLKERSIKFATIKNQIIVAKKNSRNTAKS